MELKEIKLDRNYIVIDVNPFNGIESVYVHALNQVASRLEESIQWNWKVLVTFSTAHSTLYLESIQWNWKFTCSVYSVSKPVNDTNPFNGIES